MSISVDLKNASMFFDKNDMVAMERELSDAAVKLRNASGEGKDFLGWLRLPLEYNQEEFARIKQAAEKIRNNSQVLIVIGIGGSYLGARAVIEFLRSPNYNLLKKNTPDIYFVGNNLSADHINEIISMIGDRNFAINVISKSGTTTEPAIAFRIFKKLAEEKYGREQAKEYIYATTDQAKGALKQLADAEGYESFVIPDDVGGRFSVLTAVGLLPIAVSGVNIDALMQGAAEACRELSVDTMENIAWQYAAARNLLYRQGKRIEVLACYEPAFRYMS